MMEWSEYEKCRREMTAIECVMWECKTDIWKLARKHGSPSDFELFVDVDRICNAMSEWGIDNKEPDVLRDALARLRKDLQGRAEALMVVDQRAFCMERALDAWLALPREVTNPKRESSGFDIDRLMHGISSKSRDKMRIVKGVLSEYGDPCLRIDEIAFHCAAEGLTMDEVKTTLNTLCNNAEALRDGEEYRLCPGPEERGC